MTQTAEPITSAPEGSTTWREDHERATALMAQIKTEVAGGLDNMEHQSKVARMMDDAGRLFAQAKTKKGAQSTSDRLAELEQAAAGLATDPMPANASIADIVRGTAAVQPTGGEPVAPHRSLADTNPNAWKLLWAASPRVVRDFRRFLPDLYERASNGQLRPQDRMTAALNEGTGATGNYLVVPQYLQEMFAEVRRQGNALRALGWLNEHRTDQTNLVLIPKAAGAGTVGIVSELQAKPTSDNNYAQISVPIYTAAGIYNVSKQLADDADPAVSEIISRDLGTLLGNLEEQKILTGTGTGEPLGILNTPSVSTVPAATQTALNGTVTGQVLIDALIDAVATIATNYYAMPTGVLMRPSRLAFLQKTKDTAGNYVLNQPGTFRAPAAVLDSVTSQSEGTVAATWGLFGIPVAASTNIPQNLGGGTNQDAAVVANWREAHWFQRMDITLDASDIAGDAFETNKVKYRLEERFGFTAQRYPGAFCPVTGTGMTAIF